MQEQGPKPGDRQAVHTPADDGTGTLPAAPLIRRSTPENKGKAARQPKHKRDSLRPND